MIRIRRRTFLAILRTKDDQSVILNPKTEKIVQDGPADCIEHVPVPDVATNILRKRL